MKINILLFLCFFLSCKEKNRNSNANIINSKTTISILKEIYLAKSEFDLTEDTNRILSLEEIHLKKH
jgi:hypothetical protein